jgi:CubicO group peptidase (beta-lactamase class C family)
MNGFDAADSAALAAVRSALEGGTFPSAVVSIRRAGRGGRAAFGAADESTVYDLASLTKPLATTILVLRAAEAGALDLDARLDRYLPEARGGANGATVRDLLSHSGGLPAIPALERRFPDPEAIDRRTAISALLEIEPEKPPRETVVYSCTGFLLLGLVLERLSGQRLADLFRAAIALPLGLAEPGSAAGYAAFLPDEAARRRAAPTEFCPWRNRRIRGEVHDESSFCLGGDGGNAGLFADAAGAELLFGVYENGGGLLKSETVAEARRLQTEGLDRRRGLGLQLHDGESFDGPRCPQDSYGHTGFTGTSAWRSLAADTTAVVLSNRVYYGREETAEKIAAFRRAFHAAL